MCATHEGKKMSSGKSCEKIVVLMNEGSINCRMIFFVDCKRNTFPTDILLKKKTKIAEPFYENVPKG